MPFYMKMINISGNTVFVDIETYVPLCFVFYNWFQKIFLVSSAEFFWKSRRNIISFNFLEC